MATESGYLYVNLGNTWPSVILNPGLQNTSGVIGLKPVGALMSTSGAFRAGPFQVSDQPTSWFRVQAILEGGAESLGNSHVQFFTFVSVGGSAPWNPASSTPFTDPGWIPATRDALDFAVKNAPGLVFFLGAVFRGDGTESPLLDQIRIEYGRDTWSKFLPPVYRKDAPAADFLDRFLTIEQSVLNEVEREIEDLPLLFDPHATPESWREWLSGWLTFVLEEHWGQEEARANLAGAFGLYSKRGTIEGLTEYLRIYAGVNAIIEEPSRAVSIWPLGSPNLLGFGTMLAPGPLQGAVLGTTAVADQSHLTTGQDFGAALFEDVAHRFCVSVYCAELTTPGALDIVRAVLDREKPAHTVYELCVIEPALRVGVQARVGIDSIVAAGAPFAGTGLPLGADVLAPQAQPCSQVAG